MTRDLYLMRFSFTHPMSAGCYDPLLVSGIGLSSMARIAETAGFDGISFTDHPIPSSRWLAAGGHEALDPFSALAFCAAATVLPYIPVYNPPIAIIQFPNAVELTPHHLFEQQQSTILLKRGESAE